MPPPVRRPLLLLRLLLPLLLPASAVGVDLRDAGYGDGSLVDSSGNYYYPQPNGGYLDTYGAAFNPLGDGLYSDAIGNTIDLGPTRSGPPGSGGAEQESAPTPVRNHYSVDHDRSRTPADADHPDARSDTTPNAGYSDFGPRYLEDVGDGYLNLTPNGSAPESTSASPQDQAHPAVGPAPGTPESFAIEDIEALGPPPGESAPIEAPAADPTGPRRRGGPVQYIPQRLRPTD